MTVRVVLKNVKKSEKVIKNRTLRQICQHYL